MDAACLGLRDSQVFHLHPGPIDGCGDAKGGQDFEGMGLEHWKDAQTRKLPSDEGW